MTEITAIYKYQVGPVPMELKKSNLNSVLCAIRTAKREGTNVIRVPAKVYDRHTAAWLRSYGYKAERLPVRRAVEISWEYKESARRSGR